MGYDDSSVLLGESSTCFERGRMKGSKETGKAGMMLEVHSNDIKKGSKDPPDPKSRQKHAEVSGASRGSEELQNTLTHCKK